MLALGAVAAVVAGLLVVAPRELDRDTSSAALAAAGEASIRDESPRAPSPNRPSSPTPLPSDPGDEPPLTLPSPSDDPPLTLPSPAPPDPAPVPGDPGGDPLEDLFDEAYAECLDVALLLSSLLLEPLVGVLGEEALGPEVPAGDAIVEDLPPELHEPARVLLEAYETYGDVVDEYGPFSDEALDALDALGTSTAAGAFEAFDTWFQDNC